MQNQSNPVPITMASDSSLTDEREEIKGDDSQTVAAAEELQGGGDSSRVSLLDRISGLPDEILVKILSPLSLKELVRTSILSNRWKSLWTLAITVLDFEALEELEQTHDCISLKNSEADKIRWEKRRWYINWVNEVLRQLHATSKVSKFRISFNLDHKSNSNGDIDRWLDFAISKRVEFLELSLEMHTAPRKGVLKFYRFSQRCFKHIKTPAGLIDIKSLRCLRFRYVNVKGMELQHFISNCPLLEELSVLQSNFLEKLKVVGSSSSPLPLKHLEVRRCTCLKSLEIDHAPHLTHLAYEGLVPEMHVNNCACLVNVDFGFHSIIIASPVGSLSGYTAGRLESLRLDLRGCMRFHNVPEFTNLELLTIKMGGSSSSSLSPMIPVINACPRLNELRLELFIFDSDSDSKPYQWFRHVDKVRRESIKVVQIVGFTGYNMECEFIAYVLEYFVGLQKVVVDRSLTTCFKRLLKYDVYKEKAEKARKVALEFKSRVSSSLEFIVI